MNGIPNRVVRLVTLVSVAAVSILGSTQAMAAAPITYYQGAANGTALAVAATPDALLNVKLTQVSAILSQLATTLQLDPQLLGLTNTLADATKPINVVVDQAHSVGTSAAGQALTGGTSTTTPVSIDAASLNAEVAALNAALHQIPAGAITQLKVLLGNLPSNSNLAPVIQALTDIGNQLTTTLGNPNVNALDTATVNFGDLINPVNNANVTTGPSFITNGGPFALGPFSAEALGKDSSASNNLLNLDLLRNFQITIPSASQLKTLLDTVASTLATLEAALTKVVVTVVPAPVGTLLGGTLPTLTGLVDTSLQTALNTINGAYNQLSSALSALGVLNGVNLNDLAATDPQKTNNTALSTLSRDLSSGLVSSNGQSNLAHVDILKLNNPLLRGLLGNLGPVIGGALSADSLPKSLVSIDGVKGVAAVTANGTDPMSESFNGQLLDVSVLGKSLASITGSLDAILPPGTACIIQVPGTINCPGLAGGAAVAALNALNGVLGNVPVNLAGLITITLTRGANSVPGLTSGDVKNGKASIVTLEVNVAVDCGKVNNLVPLQTLNDALKATGISLCAAAAGSSAARSAHATTAPAGSASLVDVQLGQADAALTLNASGLVPVQTRIPNTGDNALILAAFGLVLAAAGIGINRRKRLPIRP